MTEMNKQIDITIPRECVYQQFEDKPGPCPRCGGPLQESTQTYLIATRRGKRITDSFVASNDMGWFCTHCPTVVINPEQLSDVLQHGLPRWDVGNEFTVLGVIDLDAVPEEKQHLPLGDDDNPIPLVEFTNTSRKTAPGRPARRRKTTPRKRTARARKNEEEEEVETQPISIGGCRNSVQ
jgi:hypothetical protein